MKPMLLIEKNFVASGVRFFHSFLRARLGLRRFRDVMLLSGIGTVGALLSNIVAVKGSI